MKNLIFIFLLLSSLLLFSENSFAQKDSFQIQIELKNSSFEANPRPGKEPEEWNDCGVINFPDETPPDIHPVKNNPPFEVKKEAYDGKTYLGLVVRENDSWESVGQRLSFPLFPNVCYSLDGYLCKSENYRSSIRGSDQKTDFVDAIILRIWGGNNFCEKKELLAESELIDNTDWKKYQFYFSPKEKFDVIILEAYFQTPTLKVPNGNILLDKFSEIQLVSCDKKRRELKSKDYPEELLKLIKEKMKE